MQADLRIICAEDAFDDVSRCVHTLFESFAIADYDEVKKQKYWKADGFLEVNYRFRMDSVDAEELQLALASMCHAEKSDVLVGEDDIEIGCYAGLPAMENDHQRLFAMCYIKI